MATCLTMLSGKFKYLFAFTAGLLFCSLLDDLPYIYFQILRFVVTASAIFYAFLAHSEQKTIVMAVFSCIAILFNPLIPFYMKRETWIIVDISTGIIFLLYGLYRIFPGWNPKRNLISDDPITTEDKILEETIDEIAKILEMPTDMKNVFKENVFSTERDFYIEKIKSMKEPIGGWLFLFAANFAADNLETGRFHVYRGVLGMEGQIFMRIFYKATDLSVERGVLNKEIADKNKNLVRNNIKEVG